MKNALLIISCYLLFSCTASKYKVEDQLYECLKTEYNNQVTDIEPLIDSLEAYCIQQGALNDESGKSKYEFYRIAAKTGELPKMYYTKITDSVLHMQISINNMESCLYSGKGLDSTNIKSSKYYLLRTKLEELKEINVQNVAKCYSQILTPEDLEHPYFRAQMIITFSRAFNQPEGYIRE